LFKLTMPPKDRHQHDCSKRGGTSFILALLGIFIFLPSLSAETTPSESTPSASTAEFLRMISSAPALRAAALGVDAARQSKGAAGLLPDPEVEAMVSRMNGAMGDRNDIYEVSVRQPLPRHGELGAERQRASAEVTMAEANYAMAFAEVAADTAMALSEAQGAKARLVCISRQVDRLDSVLLSLDTSLATVTADRMGARLANRLMVQTRLASMRLMLENDQRMVDDALAEARSRLGLSADQPLPPFVVPEASAMDLNSTPALRAVAARTALIEAMAGMAKSKARPMTAVGLRYEREYTQVGNDNTVGISISSDLPWRGRRVSSFELEVASSEHAAAQAEAAAVTYRIRSAIARAERATRFAESSRRTGTETLARLEAEIEAFLISTSVGNPMDSTVNQMVDLLEKATEAEIQVIAAEQAERNAHAELWRYASANQFPWPVR